MEGLCAVIALLYGTLLVLFTNYGALQVSYENGDLNSTIVVFAGACVGWVGLRLVRSPDAAQLGWSSVVHAPLAWWA
ncbi:hypothetical protein [Streptomyces coeruleorubidus]|uniref:hypothetical protein n=1 Tax=Streptomyces coeruleorubidus TaxID=116188 RepID=UPI0033E4008C